MAILHEHAMLMISLIDCIIFEVVTTSAMTIYCHISFQKQKRRRRKAAEGVGNVPTTDGDFENNDGDFENNGIFESAEREYSWSVDSIGDFGALSQESGDMKEVSPTEIFWNHQVDASEGSSNCQPGVQLQLSQSTRPAHRAPLAAAHEITLSKSFTGI